MTIAPFKKSIQTKAPLARAFDLFTGNMTQWWPRGMTIGAKHHVEIIVEPHADGRWFERDEDGAETQWGKVLAWSPPERLLLGWQLNAEFTYDPTFLTEVELTFVPADGGGTIVTLEHRDLERFGVDAPRHAEQIESGWSQLLGKFAAYVDSLD